MGSTPTLLCGFFVRHIPDQVGFQESGKLEHPEVPRKLNSHIFMTLPLGFMSRPHC